MATGWTVPLATRSVGFLDHIDLMSANDDGYVAVADHRQVSVYDMRSLSPQLDLRRQPQVFSTNTIPVKNALQVYCRIKAVLMHGDFLWVALVDGGLKVWNWRSGAFVGKVRRSAGRVVEALHGNGLYNEVIVYWNIGGETQYTSIFAVDTQKLVLVETIQGPMVFDEFQNIGGQFTLGFNRKVLQITPVAENSKYRRIRCDLDTTKFDAATAAVFNGELHVYLTVRLQNNNVVLSYFKPNCDSELGDMTPLHMSECKANRFVIANCSDMHVKTMLLFRNMLMVGVAVRPDVFNTGAVRPSVQFWCPRQLQCLRVMQEPTFELNSCALLNRRCPQETLMMLGRSHSGMTFARLMTARWSFFYDNIICAVLSSKRSRMRFPNELWKEVITFF